MEHIEYIKKDYRSDLLRRLKGRIFHVTTATAFEHIQTDRVIFQNKSGRLPINFASKNSFGRKNGWVCLFDLRNQSDESIHNALMAYDFLRPGWFVDHKLEQTESNLLYLFIHPSKYSEIIPNSHGKPCEYFVPKVECWYPGDMPLEHIEHVLSVRIIENVPIDPILRAVYYAEYGLGKMNADNV